jgi:hypothetical protein
VVTVEEDRDAYLRMWIMATRRHLDLVEHVLEFAAQGQWKELVEYTAEHLEGVDGWHEDTALYKEALARAERVRTQILPLLGQISLLPDIPRGEPILNLASAGSEGPPQKAPVPSKEPWKEA